MRIEFKPKTFDKDTQQIIVDELLSYAERHLDDPKALYETTFEFIADQLIDTSSDEGANLFIDYPDQVRQLARARNFDLWAVIIDDGARTCLVVREVQPLTP